MVISPLNDLVKKYQPNIAKEDVAFVKEFVLLGLVQFKKLSKVQQMKEFKYKILMEITLEII